MAGRLIGLVGTSSVGKSTTARKLQLLLPQPYLLVGHDHFYDMFPSDWGGHTRGPGPGFWQQTLTDEDGKPRIVTHYGEAGRRMFTGMRAAVVALLDAGNNIILDEMPVDDTIMPAAITATAWTAPSTSSSTQAPSHRTNARPPSRSSKAFRCMAVLACCTGRNLRSS